jgi:hypothetical protein
MSTITETTVLAIRRDDTNPNHHLWNNHGIWWCHFTVHLGDFTKRRVRVTLETRDVEEARRRRDALLRQAALGEWDHIPLVA